MDNDLNTLTEDVLEEEYEPTAEKIPVRPRWQLIRVLYRVIWLMFVGMVVISGVARVFPPPMLFAYETRSEGDGRVIYLFDARTGVSAPMLTSELVRESRWLPDGSGLLLLEARSWTVNTLAGETRPPTFAERIGMRPDPSPDWTRALSMEEGELVLFDGMTSRVLLRKNNLGREVRVLNLSWSPDNRQIALSSQASRTGGSLREVMLLNVDTGYVQVASREPAFYTSLSWSPDGSHLAFVDPRYDIQLVDSIDGTLSRLPYPHMETIDAMAWTPDGEELTFATRGGRLYMLDVETQTSEIVMDGLDSSTELAWSPDGRWLAISTGSLIDHRLLMVDAVTGRVYPLHDNLRANGLFAWQP